MDIKVRGKNIKLTEINKSYVLEKSLSLESFLEKSKTEMSIVATKFQRYVKIEVNIVGENGVYIKNEYLDEDFYRAVDVVLQRTKKEIKKRNIAATT